MVYVFIAFIVFYIINEENMLNGIDVSEHHLWFSHIIFL